MIGDFVLFSYLFGVVIGISVGYLFWGRKK